MKVNETLKRDPASSIFFFFFFVRLLSYMWVLDPQPHPLPSTFKEGGAIRTRAQPHQLYSNTSPQTSISMTQV